MKLKWWKMFLLMLLAGRIDGDEPVDGDDPIDEDDDVDEDLEPDDEDVDEDLEPDDEDDDAPPPKKETRAQKEIRTLRERAQTAERQHQEAMAELARVRQPAQPAQPTLDQQIWEQEEAILKDPNSTDWQKYAVTSARDARIANANSRQAMREMEDQKDLSKFLALATTNPKVYAKYKDRVEETLKQVRANGNNVPREKLLALHLGEDMLAGKIKSPPTKKSPSNRQLPPGARSDTPLKGGRLTDAERVAKRLENVRI